ncbi:hypothetical protein EDD85DRAFT_838338 [Armillaria nabsnona]|nr:hypothetical protein EDD85DRAFT_838338 [Armillaria nabsnona]
MSPAAPIQYPPELLFRICSHVYSACLPPINSSLDPLITTECGVPTSLPSSVPPGNWSEPITRRTLASLCLVNHDWYDAAKPWLWRKLEVRLPRSWLSLVDEIAWEYDEETVDQVMEKTARAAAETAVKSGSSSVPTDKEAARKLQESILYSIHTPEDAISPDLLSPMASREPSPRRFRHKSKSPARWELVRSISTAIQDVMERQDPAVYIPTPQDTRPGRFIRHLDFNHFRTIGMRRSVEEGVNSRFVTGDRVEAVLKEMPNLTTFGATEYMDGALTFAVLNELFLRGAPSRGRGRNSRGRALTDTHDVVDEDRERRRQCLDLEAVDLTGCVSAVFVKALTDFVTCHIIPSDTESENGDDASRRSHSEDQMTFPGLQRLGLRGVKSILPDILTPFVLAFSSLTHLDLSGTRVTPELLAELGKSSTVRLNSLALARCVRLTGESIKTFLVESLVSAGITELNLYGDATFGCPLSHKELKAVVSFAPCFVSGELLYLDLSSAPIDEEILQACVSLPKLRSFGISHIPDLRLDAIANFLQAKASKVEVLTLIGTSPELDCGMRPGSGENGAPRGSSRQSCIALHSYIIRPLCSAPFSFSLTVPSGSRPPPTRLRVVELSTAMLCGLGAGAGSWRTVRSKGGRGWYVDTASGWVAQSGDSQLRRDLEPKHSLRVELEKLSEANGNVSSGVGWHARKMEILHGYGMLGREDGLYGAVSFAYQG